MPTYEYACQSCGEHVEAVQSFGDDPLTTCPACGGTLRKVFGSIGVVFKGSGFYKTDSRSAKKSSDGAGDKTATKSESGSSDSKGSPSSGDSATKSSSKEPSKPSSKKEVAAS